MHRVDLNELSVLKNDIKKLRDSIRQKHRELSHDVIDEEEQFKKQFKPITESLKQLKEQPFINIKQEKIIKNEEEEEEEYDDDSYLSSSDLDTSSNLHHGKDSSILDNTISSREASFREMIDNSFQKAANKSIIDTYIDNFMRSTDKPNSYGVHFNPVINKWQIGDKVVNFDNKHRVIIVDGKNKFTLTHGLLELIFKAVPDTTIYKSKDLKNYKNILELTGVHLDSWGRVKRNTSFKYAQIIKKLFPPKIDLPLTPIPPSASISGMGGVLEDMQIEMSPEKRRKDYVYWDNPNELCERLELLVNSKQAGHTGHDAEIMSIVEELREIGVIIGGNLKI